MCQRKFVNGNAIMHFALISYKLYAENIQIDYLVFKFSSFWRSFTLKFRGLKP